MALLQKISGGPSPLTVGGRTTTCGGCATSYLDNIAWLYWLDDGDDDDDIPLLPV
jgi:hypothetical protein